MLTQNIYFGLQTPNITHNICIDTLTFNIQYIYLYIVFINNSLIASFCYVCMFVVHFRRKKTQWQIAGLRGEEDIICDLKLDWKGC